MMTMNLNKLSVWAVGACLCAASISHAAAAGIDSYDAALKKVKEVKVALEPLKSQKQAEELGVILGCSWRLEKGKPT